MQGEKARPEEISQQLFQTVESDGECEFTLEKTPTMTDFAIDSPVSSIVVSSSKDFLVAGFNNGCVRLYPLTESTMKSPVLLGQFHAKGMYTSLNVNVEISDNSKYVFAGVYRGSTDAMIFDLSSLDDIKTHSRSDAKLKGFGALGQTEESYYLLCGLGIKNMHIWRVTFDKDGTPCWKWILDHQTNGLSIEFMGFHDTQPHLIYSKSENQNLRLWDMSPLYSTLTNETKSLEYHDIHNSRDILTISGQFGYGGKDRLAIIDLTDENNRIELDLPVDGGGNRRRRQIQLIDTITGTVDPITGLVCAIVTCSNGKVLYHRQSNEIGMHAPLTTFDRSIPEAKFMSLQSQLLVIATTKSIRLELLDKSKPVEKKKKKRVVKKRVLALEMKTPAKKIQTPAKKKIIETPATPNVIKIQTFQTPAKIKKDVVTPIKEKNEIVETVPTPQGMKAVTPVSKTKKKKKVSSKRKVKAAGAIPNLKPQRWSIEDIRNRSIGTEIVDAVEDDQEHVYLHSLHAFEFKNLMREFRHQHDRLRQSFLDGHAPDLRVFHERVVELLSFQNLEFQAMKSKHELQQMCFPANANYVDIYPSSFRITFPYVDLFNNAS